MDDHMSLAALVDDIHGSIVLVTGAGRGLGREVARQLSGLGATVIACARRLADAQATVEQILTDGGKADPVQLDVTSDDEVAAAARWFSRRLPRLDILINNAGVYLDDPRRAGYSPENSSAPSALLETLNTNVVGPYRVIRAFMPSLERSATPKILNVSSGMGRIVELDGFAPFYRTSKAALNILSYCLSRRKDMHGVQVNAACPGWIRTDMGGLNAPRTVEEGARSVIRCLAAQDHDFNGLLLRDGERFGW